MPEKINYENLGSNRKEAFNKIVEFGKGHGFSSQEIKRVLLLAFAESSFDEGAASGTGPIGTFQFGAKRWEDYCSDDLYSKVGEKIYNQLQEWGYEPAGSKESETPPFDRQNIDDQIKVIYAEYKIYAGEFNSGSCNTAFSKEWKAYGAALDALGNNPSTDPSDKMMLFFEAAHHGSSNISEVVTGWKNKVLPNLNENFMPQQDSSQAVSSVPGANTTTDPNATKSSGSTDTSDNSPASKADSSVDKHNSVGQTQPEQKSALDYEQTGPPRPDIFGVVDK